MVDEDVLRARFSLVEIDDEGVLLDNQSGAVFRLNRTACAIWTELKAGASLPSIAATLARRFGVAPEVADRDARAALLELPTTDADRLRDQEPAGSRWEESPSGYVLREQGVITCEVDGQGTSLRLPVGDRPAESEARRRIRSVVARVLALRGIHLLHASAVEIDGQLTVFTGLSGAGKTTTARAFARTGARLISEDLLVLAPALEKAHAIAGGELIIREWVSDQAVRLVRYPGEAVQSASVERCVDGDQLTISRILLVDAKRRSGGEIRIERLQRPDALVSLMESVYFASTDPAAWRARFHTLQSLATKVETSKATMPEGLQALDSAVQAFRQKVMMAS